MQVTDAQLQGAALAFKSSARPVRNDHRQRRRCPVKFLGTPVEDSPWELKRPSEALYSLS